MSVFRVFNGLHAAKILADHTGYSNVIPVQYD